jgi:hypothetical protein
MTYKYESYKKQLMDVAQEAASYFAENRPENFDDEALWFIEREADRYAYLLKLFISLDKGKDLSFEGPKNELSGLRQRSPYVDAEAFNLGQ